MNVREKIEAAIKEVEEGTNFEIITEMKAALNSVYGEQRNQITKPTYESVIKRLTENGLEPSSSERIAGMKNQSDVTRFLKGICDCLDYQIIIHFPEVTIKNEKDSHLIRDIYVRVFLKQNGMLRSYIQGMRTTLTEAEYLSQYVHSHLPRFQSRPIIFHQFCTGIGEINQVLAILSNKYTSANFMMLLMHIKNYLEWESKEGHPYMFIENIFKRSTSSNSYNHLSDNLAIRAADCIIDTIKVSFSVDDLMKLFTFDVTERKIKVVSTLELEKWMGKQIEDWDTVSRFNVSNHNQFLSLRDNSGNYYALPETTRRMNYERGPILNFKGRDIEFEVIEKSSQTQQNETFANPKITKETCEKLSRKLTKAALSSAGIKSGSSLVYNIRTSEPDNIPVQGSVDRGVVGDALL